MYLPREHISQLYQQLVSTTHPSTAPVLLLTALTVDSLCATRIFASLLKRDFVPHTIVPVSGYADLQRVGAELVLPLARQRGGNGGTVVCLGLGGAVALEETFGLDGGIEGDAAPEDLSEHGIEVWVIDAHRPWHLQNVFGAYKATTSDDAHRHNQHISSSSRVASNYNATRGNVIVWDDGDLEIDLRQEREAYFALQDMPDITEDDLALDGPEEDNDADDARILDEDVLDSPSSGQKRKRRSAISEDESSEDDSEDESRPRRRRRSNSNDSIIIASSPGGNPISGQSELTSTPPTVPSSPPKRQPSAKQMRRDLLKLRRKHEATLDKYYDMGSSDAEPVSSMVYSLASELGREDKEMLWLAIVGVSSVSAFAMTTKVAQIRELLQDETRRLNPIPQSELQQSQSSEAVIPTTARSPTDTSIRLSPEPRFLLIRHWSLYESMLHSPYLATRLHVWSDSGRKRLHKLLAKMGISLNEANKGYLHMDIELKRTLRSRILKFAEQYNLDGLVPSENSRVGLRGWGFVRSWGWRGTLSAEDVAITIGAILEVGIDPSNPLTSTTITPTTTSTTYNSRVRHLPSPPTTTTSTPDPTVNPSSTAPDYITHRFFTAYDALAPITGFDTLRSAIPTAQALHRAILRVGSALLAKKQIRHLRAFRMAVVKDGPDVPLFTHAGALVRLAGWVGEAVGVLEAEKGARRKGTEALVLAALDEGRGVFVVVGVGGGGGGGGFGGGNGSGRYRTKAEIREREERRKRKGEERERKRVEREKARVERRRLRRERDEANGVWDSDEEESEAETEEVESSSDESDDDEMGGSRRKQSYNRFGQAFQEVVEETGARVRIDSFEHSVVEVKKEDLGGFLEALSLKTVVA